MADETDKATLLAILDKPNPLEANGDVLADIPFQCLDPAPWNPKGKIVGKYRRGLRASLGHFKLSDHLKVWPKPGGPNRFYLIDGNQRIDVLAEMLEDYYASLEAVDRAMAELAGGDPLPEAELIKFARGKFQGVLDDQAAMPSIRSRAMAHLIPCRIKASLDAADAKAFTATFDRNHAKVDEVKQASLVDEIIAQSEVQGEVLASLRKRMDAMTRPERPFVLPVPRNPGLPSSRVSEDDEVGETALAGRYEHISLPPSGPPAASKSAGPLVPVMFSMPPEAAAELRSGLLRCAARIVKCKQLQAAVTRFVSSSPDADLSEAAAEIALLCLERRVEIAEAAS